MMYNIYYSMHKENRFSAQDRDCNGKTFIINEI